MRRPSTRQGVGHLLRQALLEVQLPARVVGVRLTADFHVTPDAGRARLDQPDGPFAAPLLRDRAAKAPAATVPGAQEVLRLDPGGGLVPVPAARPTPQLATDPSVHVRQPAVVRYVPV